MVKILIVGIKAFATAMRAAHRGISLNISFEELSISSVAKCDPETRFREIVLRGDLKFGLVIRDKLEVAYQGNGQHGCCLHCSLSCTDPSCAHATFVRSQLWNYTLSP